MVHKATNANLDLGSVVENASMRCCRNQSLRALGNTRALMRSSNAFLSLGRRLSMTAHSSSGMMLCATDRCLLASWHLR